MKAVGIAIEDNRGIQIDAGLRMGGEGGTLVDSELVTSFLTVGNDGID